jgi:hypothetical protein
MQSNRPLSGKLVAIDKEAKSVIIGPIEGVASTLSSNMVCFVATNTVIIKAGKRVPLTDVTVGEPVRFRARKGNDGKNIAAFLMVGNPPPARTTGTTPAPPAGGKK